MKRPPDFSFASPREHHYEADACLTWCFDDRFSPLLEEYKEERGFKHSDVIESAGGAKALAADGGPERDFLLDQIKTSIRLHKTPLIILTVHIDCGGYGGSKAFQNDAEAEYAHHEAELKKAAEFLRTQLPPEVEIETWLADFDGMRQIAAATAIAA